VSSFIVIMFEKVKGRFGGGVNELQVDTIVLLLMCVETGKLIRKTPVKKVTFDVLHSSLFLPQYPCNKIKQVSSLPGDFLDLQLIDKKIPPL